MHDLITKASMVTLLGVATPIDGTGTAWAQWGLAGLVVGYSLWRDHDRERRMGAALDRQEAWIRMTLGRLMAENTAAIKALTRQLYGEDHG